MILCYLYAVSVQCVFNSQPCEAAFISSPNSCTDIAYIIIKLVVVAPSSSANIQYVSLHKAWLQERNKISVWH